MKKTILLVFLSFVVNNLVGQDNHYWTQQYGARSTLMGGSVIAGVRDNSAIFYNPGAIAFIPHNNISISANLYRYEQVDVKNGAGTNLDLSSRKVGTFPQMISGLFAFKNEKWEGGYMLMMRHNSAVNFNIRNQSLTNVFSNTTTNQEYIGAYELDNDFSEQWGGLAMSYMVNRKISVGFTPFFAYRSHNYRFDNFARAIPLALEDSIHYVASFTHSADINFNNLRMLGKAGVAIDLGKIKLGITATTPSLNLFGNGDAEREISSQNLNRNLPDSLYPSFLIIDRQTQLKTTYRSPFSIGIGIEYHTEKTVISLASERFSKVDIYHVMAPETPALTRPSNVVDAQTQNEFLMVSALAKPVWNVGVGIEKHLSKSITVLAGFRTDFNYFTGNYSNVKGLILNPGSWDLYHLSGGVTFKRHSSEITTGINYGFGGLKKQNQYTNLSEPKDNNYLFGIKTPTADIKVNSLNFVIGIVHYIHKQ